MSITPYGRGAYRTSQPQSFVSTRSQLDELQRQLVTKQKSETYGGLGVERRTSLDLNAKVSKIDSWLQGIERADVNLSIATQGVESFAKLTRETVSDTRSNSYVPSSTGFSAPQVMAQEKFKQTLDILNTDVNGRYLFSGRMSDIEPVAGFSEIVKGDGAGRDGLETLIAERKLADGTASTGRLNTTVDTAALPPTVTAARDTANAVYGFQLSTPPATTNSAALSITALAGTPAGFSISIAGQPLPGETVEFKLGLPDGSSHTVVLTARAPGTTPDDAKTFEIGATPAATATALGASIAASLAKTAQTELRAASAIFTANGFFSDAPPMRVNTADFTAAPTADPSRTVSWYRGETGPDGTARQTASVQIDQAQSVSVGARANEEAFRSGLAAFAVMSLETFPTADTYPQAGYEALIARVSDQLGFGDGVQSPSEIITEFASAQTTIARAKERHDIRKNTLVTALEGVQNVSTEEVAVQILALQTQLEASYQTTSILSKLSLTNYL